MRKIRLSRMQGSELAIVQVFFLFVTPIALLYFHIVPIEARIPMLLVFSLWMYGIVKKEKWTERDFGLSLKTITPALPAYITATGIALVAIMYMAVVRNMPPASHWWTKPHFLFLFLVVSFFQEFAFRGFLMPVLHRITKDALSIILINATLFAFMHAIYPFPTVALPLAFAGGLFFAGMYYRYPNLILVSLSHAILNFAAVWYGFFTLH
jgi:membrane protease YdiL (CAAX protease family)